MTSCNPFRRVSLRSSSSSGNRTRETCGESRRPSGTTIGHASLMEVSCIESVAGRSLLSSASKRTEAQQCLEVNGPLIVLTLNFSLISGAGKGRRGGRGHLGDGSHDRERVVCLDGFTRPRMGAWSPGHAAIAPCRRNRAGRYRGMCVGPVGRSPDRFAGKDGERSVVLRWKGKRIEVIACATRGRMTPQDNASTDINRGGRQ